jgi:2-phospho-L-lactate transferase/gluconeogenesis factor (CofD/UPF0052 family)
VCHIFERWVSRLVHAVFQKKLDLFPVSDERVKVAAEFGVTERFVLSYWKSPETCAIVSCHSL